MPDGGRRQVFLELDAVLVPGGGLVNGIEAVLLQHFANLDAVADHAFQIHIHHRNTVHPAPDALQALHQLLRRSIPQRCLHLGGDHEFFASQSISQFHIGLLSLVPVPGGWSFQFQQPGDLFLELGQRQRLGKAQVRTMAFISLNLSSSR
jgi:hypothetical protein